MIKSISNISLPASTNSTAERVPEVYRTRALSGRMITRYGYDKWKLTYQLPEDTSLDIAYQINIYSVLLGAMQSPISVSFINPYTGREETITAKCTDMGALSPMALSNYAPRFYDGISFTFEEV